MHSKNPDNLNTGLYIMVAICCLISTGSFAGVTRGMGTTGSVLQSVLAADVAATQKFELITSLGEVIPTNVRSYFFEDGRLTMSGSAINHEHSSFILKGTEDKLYGWLVLEDRDIAYEYTTHVMDGRSMLVAVEVPIGAVHIKCDMPREKNYHAPELQGPRVSTDRIPEPHIGSYDGSDVRKLQSRKGAEKVIYMDITRIMNGDQPTNLSKEEMWENWQSLSAFFSPWDVNVTTDEDLFEATDENDVGIGRFRGPSGGSSCCLNCFGTGSYCVMEDERDGYSQGRIASHEFGHMMGLRHDGGYPGESNGTYFYGFSDYHWTPLMGNIWVGDRWGDDALYQLSPGDYETATVQEDDLEDIDEELDYRDDDKPGTTVLTIKSNGVVTTEDNYGHIERNTDSDVFSFQIGEDGGDLVLTIDRIEYIGGAMLDVHALIHDSEGDLVEESNIEASRYAEFDLSLDPGAYTLTIQGGAEGNTSGGFPTYSSLGFYGIEGTITGAEPTGIHSKLEELVEVSQIDAHGRLNIDVPQGLQLDEVSLYSSQGKRVFHSNETVSYISMQDFAPGYYVVKVRAGTQTVQKKALKL